MMTVFLMNFINIFFRSLELLLLLRVLLSWVNQGFDNVFVKGIYTFTDLILEPIRGILNKLGLGNGMIDWSPLVAIVLLGFIQRLLIQNIGVLI